MSQVTPPVRGADPARSADHVYAAGVDLADIGKLRGLLDRWGERVLRRLCTAAEIAAVGRCRDELAPLALGAAFGLKEAVVKAAGGIPAAGRFTDTDASALLADLDSLLARDRLAGDGVLVSGATRAAVPAPAEATIRADLLLVEADLLLCTVLFLRRTP